MKHIIVDRYSAILHYVNKSDDLVREKRDAKEFPSKELAEQKIVELQRSETVRILTRLRAEIA